MHITLIPPPSYIRNTNKKHIVLCTTQYNAYSHFKQSKTSSTTTRPCAYNYWSPSSLHAQPKEKNKKKEDEEKSEDLEEWLPLSTTGTTYPSPSKRSINHQVDTWKTMQ